jgi:hypothetical protein
MVFGELLGRTVTMTLRRLDARSAWLAREDAASHADADLLALPRAELPDEATEGDAIEVFVYLNSEDHPVATKLVPRVELGEVAFLTVTDVTHFGAFVDWGLPKDLLVPFAEQTRDLGHGDCEPIGLMVDKSGRLAGTMRISELLRSRGKFERGEWVDGEAWRNDPEIGLFVIVERAFLGLIPAHEPHTLRRGQAASFRIAQVLPDGKLELSLRGLAHDELASDAKRVLDRLSAPGALSVSDRADPEQIRALFGLSKKAFKRAVGRLLKEGSVVLDAQGYITCTQGEIP